MAQYAFEKLEVLQISRELLKDTHQLTNNFPDTKNSVSPVAAEGPFGGLIEVLNQLILAQDLTFIQKDELTTVREKIDQIGPMLYSLRSDSIENSS